MIIEQLNLPRIEELIRDIQKSGSQDALNECLKEFEPLIQDWSRSHPHAVRDDVQQMMRMKLVASFRHFDLSQGKVAQYYSVLLSRVTKHAWHEDLYSGRQLRVGQFTPTSLDARISIAFGDNDTWATTLEDTGNSNPLEMVAGNEQVSVILAALKEILSPMEFHCFIFACIKDMKYDDIADLARKQPWYDEDEVVATYKSVDNAVQRARLKSKEIVHHIQNGTYESYKKKKVKAQMYRKGYAGSKTQIRKAKKNANKRKRN